MRFWERIKTKGIVLFLVTLLLMAGVAMAATYPFTGVTNDDTNMRSSPNSYTSNVIRRIPEGEKVTVLSESGNFYRIEVDGQTGYVFKQYVDKSAASSSTPENGTNTAPNPDTDASPDLSLGSYQLLQSGSKGDHVMALQEALIELGFLRGTADGIYGSATAQAVMAFQRANSYPVTGMADQNLQALIFNGKPLNSRGEKTQISTLPAIDGLTVRSGDKGVIVRRIQQKLMEQGFYTASITGTYDSRTISAVKAFQKKNGLADDGVCGPATQAALFGSASAPEDSDPTPSPVPSYEKPRTTVRNGSRGADAKLVQQRLIDLNYLDGKADGIFGKQSVAALKEFQKKNKLAVDGVAGSGTNAVLFSWLAVAADEESAPTPTPTPTPVPSIPNGEITKDNVVLIKLGVSGSAVLRLQLRLEELGYYTSARDSRCDSDDVAAIRMFQLKNELKIDGIAGYDTQKLLYSDDAVMYNGKLAGSLNVSYETLKKGMIGDAVKQMQSRLIELGYLEGIADGYYGTDTAEAVYYFQKNNGLVRDSIAGEKTLKLLYSSNAVANSTSAPTPTPTPTPTVKPPATITTALIRLGDRNESVQIMQQTLIRLGYLTGTADGIFGNQTLRALKEFQKANALYADGVAGSKTIAALNSAGGAPEVTDSPNQGTIPGTSIVISGRNVVYEMWYSTVRNACRKYPYCTLFDHESGISWQVHMFSYGKHAEIEPLTAADTEKMYQACGYQKWTPKPVWVIFADGTIRIATTHSVPHEVQHIRDNNFAGHSCLHFPRTMAQVTSIGPYATKHQNAVDKAWAELQASLK